MGSFQALTPDWLGLDEAQQRVLAAAQPLDAESVEVHDALGRWLLEPVTARTTLPPWPNSAMDGYAVRAADIKGADIAKPIRLPVVGRVQAGDHEVPELTAGSALRIMTGAPLPRGADSVVRVEDTDAEAEAGLVRIHSDRDAGRNIRPEGRDLQAGTTVLQPRTLITPGAVGLLAAAGSHRVSVARRARVAILAGGDELADLTSGTSEEWARVRRGHAIPDTNGPMLAALARSVGAMPHLLPLVPDERAPLRAALERALCGTSVDRRGRPAEAAPDLLVTIGGASMGDADLLKDTLLELGAHLDFWRVRIRPGSPFALAFVAAPQVAAPARSRAAAARERGAPPVRPQTRVPVLMLPGNPASAFVTFHLFVRPLLLRMAGALRPLPTPFRARTVDALPSTPALCQLHRVERVADGAEVREVRDVPELPKVRLTGATGSGLVSGLARAEALAIVPEGVGDIAAGERVLCLELEAGPGATTLNPWLGGA